MDPFHRPINHIAGACPKPNSGSYLGAQKHYFVNILIITYKRKANTLKAFIAQIAGEKKGRVNCEFERAMGRCSWSSCRGMFLEERGNGRDIPSGFIAVP